MTKNKKKIWLVIILATALILILFTPLLEIIGLTAPGLCGKNSYDKDCFCFEDEDKFKIDLFFPRYICEAQNKLIDVNTEGWEDLVENLAEQKYEELYPDCDMKYCSLGDAEYEITWTLTDLNGILERVAFIECKDYTQGKVFSGAYIDVEDGSLLKDPLGAFCTSYTQKEEGIEEARLFWRGLIHPDRDQVLMYQGGKVYAEYYYIAGCDIIGDSIGLAKFVLPEPLEATSWEIQDDETQIVNTAPNSVTFQTTHNCGVGISKPIKIVGTLDASTYCYIDRKGNNILQEGETLCKDIGTIDSPYYNLYECMNGKLSLIDMGEIMCSDLFFSI